MFINTFKGYDEETRNGIIFGIVSNTNNPLHPRGYEPVAVYEIDIEETINHIKNSSNVFFKCNSLDVSVMYLLEEDIFNGKGLIEEFIHGYMPRTDCGTPNIYVNVASIKNDLHL